MSHCKNRRSAGRREIIAIAPQVQSFCKQQVWQQQGRSIFSAMNQIWQLFLAVVDGEQLRIWQTSDRDGNTWWHGCDCKTGRSINAATESEIRAWLEDRYRQ